MLKSIVEVWPVIIFIGAGLVGIGKILYMIRIICDRLDGHDKRHDEVSKTMITFTTLAMCDKCRKECEDRNLRQFHEIKELLVDINDKRDDYVAALGDVSCRLGRIEGKLLG